MSQSVHEVDFPEEDIFDAVPFPAQINDAAFYGLAGDMTKLFSEYSEASRAGILITILSFFGNCIGRKPYILLGGMKHYTNLFVSLVGSTGDGRKGTTAIYPQKLFSEVDPFWLNDRIVSNAINLSCK